MGFDLAHTISALSKLALRASRNRRSQEEIDFFNWLDAALCKDLPGNVEAINFNLYEDGGDKWSAELVGTSTFDESSSDWACHEVYTTRDMPFVLMKESNWKTVESLFVSLLEKYLDGGKYASALKKYRAVGVGFVDGDLHILYKK